MNQVLNFLLGIIFPPVCLNCKRRLPGNNLLVICKECFDQIEINNGFYCPKCKRRIPEEKNSCHGEEKFVLAAATSYENSVVRELIHGLKYNSIKNAAEPLAEILKLYLQKISTHKKLPSVVIPVPLYPTRQKKRKFNQSSVIAQNIKGFLEATIEDDAISRIKNTQSQIKSRNLEERENNVRNCFRVENVQKIKGRDIILLDDVYTSGATIKEAVRVLKDAGVKKIIALVVAKT